MQRLFAFISTAWICVLPGLATQAAENGVNSYLNFDKASARDFYDYRGSGSDVYGCTDCIDEQHRICFRIPLNSNWGTQLWYWSNQWDYELPGHFYPLVG